MSSPTVSCIIAVYNGRKYLADAIESLLAQSRPVNEIVVVDDGSTDDSAEVAAKFGPPVRCIRQQNAGQSAARNHGVREARGELLSFLDSDDLVHPRKIERQLERFAESPQLALIDAYAQNFWSPDVPADQRQLAGWQSMTHSDKPWPEFIATWLFRRDVWDRVGKFDESRRFAEDSDWHDRVRFSGMPMETIRAVLARRRLHHSNLTRNNYVDHIDGLQRFYKEKIDRLRAQGDGRGPGISLIIPAYNAGLYLREAIDSALNQTVKPRQIIVVDDGSTDDSLAIARSYGDPVQVIAQANAGTAAARNRALAAADQPMIAFLDADDRLVPDKLERQLKALADHSGAMLCVCRVCDFWSPEVPDAARYVADHVPQLRLGQVSSWLTRREVFDRIGLFSTSQDFRFAEGSELYTRIENAGLTLVLIDDALVERRLHASNKTTNVKAHMDGIMALMKRRLDLKRGAK